MTTTKMSYLRKISWEPRFVWVPTIEEAADFINRPHEDYPDRITKTIKAIHALTNHFLDAGSENISVTNYCLLYVHSIIFKDKSFGGRFRNVNVYVGNHTPPAHSLISSYMRTLEDEWSGDLTSIDALIGWYSDFESIHPFQDGNGRVGACVVSAISHAIHPEQGYLAPLQ